MDFLLRNLKFLISQKRSGKVRGREKGETEFEDGSQYALYKVFPYALLLAPRALRYSRGTVERGG